jgi:hypothetical protein
MRSFLLNSLVLSCVLLALTARPCLAQGQNQPAGRWEIDFSVGYGTATEPKTGTTNMPPLGEKFSASGSGRFVPSWLFGDGVTIVNANNKVNSLAAEIVGLDQILTSPSASVGRGISFGGRVTRVLSNRWALEGTLDVITSSVSFGTQARSETQHTVTSFTNAFTQLLSQQSESRSVTSSFAVQEAGTQINAGADVRINLRQKGSFRLFLRAGGGVATRTGSPLTVTVTGDYQFLRLGVPFHETDTVMIRYNVASAAFFRAGGGATIALGRRYGLRGDMVVMVQPNNLRVSVETTPANVVGSPTGVGVVPGLTNSIRFSTVAGTPSSLSTTLSEFETYAGGGLRLNVMFTGGLFFRF